MTVLLAATLIMTPIASDQLEIGAGAYYAQSYDNGGWERIIERRVGWGQIDPETFPYSADGYYCVHPGSQLGARLRVMNAITGEEVVCTVADAVAPRDMAHWRNSVVIEMSYAAFVAAGGKQSNRFVVTRAEDAPA